jgi:hypothetical protein
MIPENAIPQDDLNPSSPLRLDRLRRITPKTAISRIALTMSSSRLMTDSPGQTGMATTRIESIVAAYFCLCDFDRSGPARYAPPQVTPSRREIDKRFHDDRDPADYRVIQHAASDGYETKRAMREIAIPPDLSICKDITKRRYISSTLKDRPLIIAATLRAGLSRGPVPPRHARTRGKPSGATH